jgi:hypothetical protein
MRSTVLLKRIVRENLRQGVKLAKSVYIRPRSLGPVETEGGRGEL